MDEYFIIKTVNNSNKKINYFVSVISNENYSSISIRLGNYKSTPCVEIIIDTSSESAVLQNVSNDIKCTILDNLDNHDSVLLTKIALHFVISKYPHVKEFILTDNSLIKCSDKINISLADLSFIKYHKTWYEKNFEAIPDESDVENIDIQKTIIFEELNDKININEDKFILANKKYFIKNNIDDKKIEKILKKIKKTYNENIKIYDYLYKFILNHMECLYYSYIFNTYIKNNLYGTTWKIEKDKVLLYSINYSYLTSKKRLSHQNIINRIKIFNNNKLKEVKKYTPMKKYKNINYIS
jgi:hypothetical protein